MKSQLNPLYWIDVAVFLAFSALVIFRGTWDARHVVGIALAASGFLLWLIARFQLGDSFSVRAQARTLVTTGLYSKFRHPIYFFGGIAYAGLFIAWGDPILFLIFILFYSYQLMRIRKEEKVLEHAFGEEYRRYKAKIWF